MYQKKDVGVDENLGFLVFLDFWREGGDRFDTYLFRTGKNGQNACFHIHVIQQTSKFSDVFVGLDVVLQIRVFQLLHSFQDIIALIAQMVHVWVVIGEFGAGHSRSEHVVLTRNGDCNDWYRISFITKTDSIFLRFRSVGGWVEK